MSALDDELAKSLEPGAPKPVERLEATRKCKGEGLLAGVAYIMVLPFLSDSEELNRMVKTAKDYGEATSSLER